jgi:hypothetical protein
MTSKTERPGKNHSPVRAPSGPASRGDASGPNRPALFVHGARLRQLPAARE